MNVLFVCTGNTCRSPMAAALMNGLARKQGLNITADSAGLSALSGAPASPNACLAVKAYGGDLSAHRAKPVTNALVDWADAVVCMTSRHRDALASVCPGAAHKLGMLSVPIPDPYGQSAAVYQSTAAELLAAIQDWLSQRHISADHPAK